MRSARLALFDLDHTLLLGDSDVLWCDFLVAQGVLDAGFGTRNAEMAERYRAGAVDARTFCDFYAATLRGRSATEWAPLRERFLAEEVLPRIPEAARELVGQHQRDRDLVLMTTATNRFLTELTAAHFGIAHLLATELEEAEGRFTGRTAGTLNMREGKVQRLKAWMAPRGLYLSECDSTAYSDSINDLPLLEAVRQPVAVNPDAKLAAVAAQRRWPVLKLH